MAKARRAKKREIPKKIILVPVALMGLGFTIASLNSTKIINTIGTRNRNI